MLRTAAYGLLSEYNQLCIYRSVTPLLCKEFTLFAIFLSSGVIGELPFWQLPRKIPENPSTTCRDSTERTPSEDLEKQAQSRAVLCRLRKLFSIYYSTMTQNTINQALLSYRIINPKKHMKCNRCIFKN